MSGIDIYLLPGLDGTGELFQHFQALLQEYFTPHIISYPKDRVLNYQELSEYVLERLPTDRPFILLAESFSGPIAIEIASRRTHIIKALILSATFVKSPVGKKLSFLGYILASQIFRFKAPKILIRYFLLDRNCSIDLENLFRSAINSVSKEVLAARLKNVLKVDSEERLAACQLPILYIRAGEDKLVSEVCANEIFRIKPTVKMVTITGPHLLLQSKPSDAASAIVEFLGSLVR